MVFMCPHGLYCGLGHIFNAKYIASIEGIIQSHEEPTATTYLNAQEDSRYGTKEGTPVEEDAEDGQHDGEDKVIWYI